MDMSFFGFNNSNSINTLFSSLGSNSGGMGNILSDYASIRSGAYYKLLKSYYGQDNNSSVSKGTNTPTSTSIAKDSAKKLSRIENSAEDLKESADALLARGTKNVFQKVDIKQEDGTVKKGYDTEAIYKKVNDFVRNYNNLAANAEDTNTKSIDRNMNQLISLTDRQEKTLGKIGITINKDNSLSIDKEAFLKADMEVVNGLFNGAGSYGYSVSAKASVIDSYAQNEASKSNTYGKSGAYNYNYSYGSYYNNFF